MSKKPKKENKLATKDYKTHHNSILPISFPSLQALKMVYSSSFGIKGTKTKTKPSWNQSTKNRIPQLIPFPTNQTSTIHITNQTQT